MKLQTIESIRTKDRYFFLPASFRSQIFIYPKEKSSTYAILGPVTDRLILAFNVPTRKKTNPNPSGYRALFWSISF